MMFASKPELPINGEDATAFIQWHIDNGLPLPRGTFHIKRSLKRIDGMSFPNWDTMSKLIESGSLGSGHPKNLIGNYFSMGSSPLIPFK